MFDEVNTFLKKKKTIKISRRRVFLERTATSYHLYLLLLKQTNKIES